MPFETNPLYLQLYSLISPFISINWGSTWKSILLISDVYTKPIESRVVTDDGMHKSKWVLSYNKL